MALADRQQRPSSHSSTAVSPTLSAFKFRTIGKQPDLLKRISAPEPNQDYQDDSVSSPPPHSPVVANKESLLSRPSLLQQLSPGNNLEIDDSSNVQENTPVPPSATGANTPKPSSLFDPLYATLFRNNAQIASPSSILASDRPNSPSDMDFSSPPPTSPATTSHSEERLHASSPSRSRVVPTNAETGTVNDRFASADGLDGLELAYPPTEGGSTTHPNPPHPSLIQELSARLIGVISYIKSRTVQQAKILDTITSLEGDLQAVADQMSLALDSTHEAETAVGRVLNSGMDAVTIAQQSVSAAQVAKIGADSTLATLSRFRQHYQSELVADEQACTDLTCSITSLNRDFETFSDLLIAGFSSRSDAEPSGLGSDALFSLSVEVVKLARGRESRAGFRKRKRDSDQADPSSSRETSYRPSKEARHEQRILDFDKMLEIEAEAAREAWVQEAERRSVVPPDPASRAAHGQAAMQGAPQVHAENRTEEAQASAPTEALQRQVQDSTQQGTEHTIVPSARQDNPSLDEQQSSRQNSGAEEGLEKKKELRARWERELAEQKHEITKFQMQEKPAQKKAAITNEQQQKKEQHILTKPGLVPAPVPATSISAAGTKGQDTQQMSQSKPDASASRKKEIELRLALEKQRASPATGHGSSRPAEIAQAPVQQSDVHRERSQDGAKSDLNASQQMQAQSERMQIVGDLQGQDGQQRGIVEESTTTAHTQAEKAKSKQRTSGAAQVSGTSKAEGIALPDIANITAQKELATSAQRRPAALPAKQRGKKSRTPQTTAGTHVDHPFLQTNVSIQGADLPPYLPYFPAMPGQFQMQPVAMSVNLPLHSFNEQLFPPPQTWNQDVLHQDIHRASLPPIECIIEPNQTASANTRKPPSSRSSQKRKQGSKNALPSKPVEGASSSRITNTQPSRAAVPPEIPPGSNIVPGNPVTPRKLPADAVVPKVEVVSPVLGQPSGKQPPPRRARKPPGIGGQLTSNAPQQERLEHHSASQRLTSVSQSLHDSCQGSSRSEVDSESASGPAPSTGLAEGKLGLNPQVATGVPQSLSDGDRGLFGSKISFKLPLADRGPSVDVPLGSSLSQLLPEGRGGLSSENSGTHFSKDNSTDRRPSVTAPAGTSVPPPLTGSRLESSQSAMSSKSALTTGPAKGGSSAAALITQRNLCVNREESAERGANSKLSSRVDLTDPKGTNATRAGASINAASGSPPAIPSTTAKVPQAAAAPDGQLASGAINTRLANDQCSAQGNDIPAAVPHAEAQAEPSQQSYVPRNRPRPHRPAVVPHAEAQAEPSQQSYVPRDHPRPHRPAPCSPPKAIGRKRPWNAVDDHWSPAQEERDRRGRLCRRISSSSPRPRSRSRSRSYSRSRSRSPPSPPPPLYERITEASDREVYNAGNGGQSYRPDYYTRPRVFPKYSNDNSDTGGSLLDRFAKVPGKQNYNHFPPPRQPGPVSRGLTKRGRATRPLQSRIT